MWVGTSAVNAQQSSPTLPSIYPVELVAKEIGPDGVNYTQNVGIYHADLGSMFNVGENTYALFGDSWGEGAPLSSWRANLMAYGPTYNFATGKVLNHWITDNQGQAKQLFADPNLVGTIPTGGIFLNQNMYSYFMHVTEWDTQHPGMWSCDYSSLAKSLDMGSNWTMMDNSTKWLPGNFNQVALYEQGDYLYMFGIPCGRDGGMKLMRAPKTAIEDLTQYQYYVGVNLYDQPQFSSLESDAITIVPAPAGEMSVMWNPYLNAYMMMYLNRPEDQIVMRVSGKLWGPWSETLPVVAGTDYPCLYAPYLNEKYTQENGRIVYFRMSRLCGVTNPNSTYLMKMTFKPIDFVDIYRFLNQFSLFNQLNIFDYNRLLNRFGK
jgi:hypothetical protein